MAQARMYNVESAEISGNFVRERFTVCFSGSEVSGGVLFDAITADIDPTGTPNQIQSAYTGAIRARATELGLTVPSNGVTLPSLTKG